MAWRTAKALDTLLAQVNAKWPNRSKAADGSIGDAAHSSRTSDHNPNPAGVVCARDFTHDPAHGLDSEALAEALRASRDPRIKYIISNKKIASPPTWAWRPYNGSNPHNHHVHVSVTGVYDSIEPWKLDGVAQASPTPGPTQAAEPVEPLLRVGAKGKDVERLQTLLNSHGAKLKIDGDYGPVTKRAVQSFQKAHGLTADGSSGPYTWSALKGEPK